MRFAHALLVAFAVVLAAALLLILAAAVWPRPDGTALRAMLTGLPHSRYTAGGRYVGPDSPVVADGTSLAKDGVPHVFYRGLGYRANPTSAAQYGLRAYGRWLTRHRRSDRLIVLRAADWLTHWQSPDGRWPYRFDFAPPGGPVDAPWTSAMAQGQAMSLLERAYRLTGSRAYLGAAVRALRPLEAQPGRHLLVRCFDGCAHPFFEEYPTRPRSDVLNGFMFTLVGLYDLASVAPRSAAAALYRAGRSTLHLALPEYDENGVARYSLSSDRVASQEYQAIHVYLLRALNSLAPDPRLVFYARRWLTHLGRAPAS